MNAAIDAEDLVRILVAKRKNYRQIKESAAGISKSTAKAKEDAIDDILRVVRDMKQHSVEVES